MEILTLVIEKLWDRLSDEYETFQGVEDQVTELKSKLNSLKSFLKDADAKKHTSERVRNCVEEIKEIVYDADDITESFFLKEKFRNIQKRSIMRRIKIFASTILDRMEFVSDIGGIIKRITNVIQDMQSFGVQELMNADGGQSSHPLRKEFARGNESNLVGMEANVKKLVGYLMEENEIQIVSVTGMGGLGKTTLARQAFNHEDVKHNFDGLAWVCVSKEFTQISVWQRILQNLTSKEKKDEILKMNAEDLQDELFRLLETSKSLIVLDDIWEDEDWDLIKPIFPPKKGWKVILTSRKESVAMRRDTSYVNFKPDYLSIPDSLTLFQTIAMPRKDASESKVDEEMEEMGKQMLKHCGGLPLAVRVLGGLLAAKYTVGYWKQVSENIGSHLVERTSSKNGSIDQVLSMSYEELPSYLKHCFLYLAHFPEDHEIDVENLSYYWAAEGISKHRQYDGETIRDVGDSYIEELVRRNMVISQRSIYTLRFETCRLHDMMREVCLLKAKEENFLQIVGIPSPTANAPCSSRRFVSRYPALDVERDINNPKLRSLMLVFQEYIIWGKMSKISDSSFKRLELLRVLDLFRAEFEGGKLPSGIGKLIHLRYLSLKRVSVTHLPASLGNLLLLIYLNLDICKSSSSIFVPNVLMGMQELRYLALPDDMLGTKLELSNLVNLETLKNFSTKNSRVKDLRGMVRLRTLEIKVPDETSIETISASIGGLRHLENVDINDYMLNMKTRKDHWSSKRNLEDEIVWDFSHLKRLHLSMYMPNLLKDHHFSSHLTTINLRNCGLEEDPMPILEKLLHLKEVTLLISSFSGKRMVCSGSGFPQLEKLKFYFLKKWEEWIVEEGSMPLLHTLSIDYCPNLKELPDGVRFITSLKELKINTPHLEFTKKLSRGGEDYYKVQHIPLLKII